MLCKTVKRIISISILISLLLTLSVHADQTDIQSELDAVAEMETEADLYVEPESEPEDEFYVEPEMEPEYELYMEPETELYEEPEEELYVEPETEEELYEETETDSASSEAYNLRMDYIQDLIQQDAYNIRMEAFEELSNNQFNNIRMDVYEELSQFTIVTPENFWTVYDTIPELTKEELAWLGMETYGVDFKWMGMLIGTTVREGYFYDPYLYYAWACAMLNDYRWYPADAVYWLMSGWGGVMCEACGAYYSEHAVVYGCNYHASYSTAAPEILKCIYMALVYRDERIFEVDGMIVSGDNNPRLIYSSPVYNCQVWSW